MMESQGKRIENVPIAEPRSLLPCSTDVLRGSALGFTDLEPPVEELLDQLAELIVQAYFYEKQHTE